MWGSLVMHARLAIRQIERLEANYQVKPTYLSVGSLGQVSYLLWTNRKGLRTHSLFLSPEYTSSLLISNRCILC